MAVISKDVCGTVRNKQKVLYEPELWAQALILDGGVRVEAALSHERARWPWWIHPWRHSKEAAGASKPDIHAGV